MMATLSFSHLQLWAVSRKNPHIRAQLARQSNLASHLEVPKAPRGISLKAMECCQSTIHDFCRSYFVFHGLDPHNPEHVFQYLPLFTYIESYIYEVDLAFEKNILKFAATIGDPLADVREELIKRDLLTQRMSNELLDAVQYWKMEQALCQTLLDPSAKISISEALHTMKIRSCDYRLLNLVLYKLRGQEVNETHFEFFNASNYILEIVDDMGDYEKDVIDNTFNIVRMFSRAYGPEAPKMLEDHIREAKAKYERLFAALEPHLREKFPARELIIRTGKDLSELWKIPDMITDEAAYRLEHSAPKDRFHQELFSRRDAETQDEVQKTL